VILVVLLCLAGIAAGGEFVTTRRTLSAQRDAIAAQWDVLSAAFDARGALIGNLSTLVQNATGSHDKVFNDAAGACRALSRATTTEDKVAANSSLINAFARLYLVADSYPRLAANAQYRNLNDEIGKAESVIAQERRKYNDLLEHYNAQLRRFPVNVVAFLAGMTRVDAYVKTEQDVP
jgi:LemA protein